MMSKKLKTSWKNREIMRRLLFVLLLVPLICGLYWNWVIKKRKAFIVGIALLVLDIIYNTIIVSIKVRSNVPYMPLTRDNIPLYERILYIIYNVMFWIAMITILVKLCRDNSKRIKIVPIAISIVYLLIIVRLFDAIINVGINRYEFNGYIISKAAETCLIGSVIINLFVYTVYKDKENLIKEESKDDSLNS